MRPARRKSGAFGRSDSGPNCLFEALTLRRSSRGSTNVPLARSTTFSGAWVARTRLCAAPLKVNIQLNQTNSGTRILSFVACPPNRRKQTTEEVRSILTTGKYINTASRIRRCIWGLSRRHGATAYDAAMPIRMQQKGNFYTSICTCAA